MLPWWLGLCLVEVCTVLAPLLFGVSRVAAGVVAFAALGAPALIAGGPPLAVSAASLLAVLPPLRLVQLALDRRVYGAGFRVWFGAMPFDARTAVRAPAGLDRAAMVSLLGHGLCFGLGLVVVEWADGHLAGGTLRAVRFAGGLAGIYGGTSAAAALYVVGHRFAGVHVAPMMRAPILARSVAEFWSRRWNLPVHALLRQTFFRPLAHRGWPRMGILASFAGSAVLHAWIVVFALGIGGAIRMGGFFVAQGLFALLEARLGVRRWPRIAAHVWTLSVFLVTAPLFIEPFLVALGI